MLDRALQTLREHGVAAQGGTIVDVGANIGTTVVTALVVHGFERGVAIEPDPENRKVLRASLALSELDDRVAVVAAAASSGAGEASFTRKRWGGGKHRIGSGRIKDDPAQTADLIRVETVSLDGLAEEGVIDADAVSLLWLDVQDTSRRCSRARRRCSAVAFRSFRPAAARAVSPGSPGQLGRTTTPSSISGIRPGRRAGRRSSSGSTRSSSAGPRLTTDMLAFNRAS